jgi:hypothetical protein
MGRFYQQDPAQYVDSLNLYEYCKSSPIGHVDFSGSVCGVIVQRARSMDDSIGSINLGHEWIEWWNYGYGKGSVGFWPNRGWVVLRPDPAAGNMFVEIESTWETLANNSYETSFGKIRYEWNRYMRWGKGAGKKCKCVDCTDITSCLNRVPNPGWRNCSIVNNCRRFVDWALEGCCMKKGKKI